MCNLQSLQQFDYAAVERMIQKLVWQQSKRCRIDYDELLAEANLGYVEACQSYKPNKGRFPAWAYWCIRGRLQNVNRTKSDRTFAKHETLLDDRDNVDRFSLRSLLFEISEDAATAVRLALECPLDILQMMREKDSEGVTIKRNALRRFLADLGWSAKKIANVFAEVKEALQ